jgi:RNA polymerase sigma-70 factor (ECF subfamily)
LDDARLIKLIRRNGQRAAADELVRRYYDEILGFVRRQIADADTAIDLTQEIFISMLRTIGYYDPRRGAGFRTWLYRIATNKVVDYFRSRSFKRAALTIPLEEVEPIDASDFTKRLEHRDFAERVCAFVGSLPPDTQKIFRLHVFGDYTFAEIARITELPEGSVKSRYYRLVNLLRKEFAADG